LDKKGVAMIYFIQDLESKRIKIGESDDPTIRIKQIMTSLPSKNGCEILAVMPGGIKREGELHQKFSQYHSRGEWYEASNEIISFVLESIKGELNLCRVCGALSLSKPDISDIKNHSIIHKTMRNGVLPYEMREVLKKVGWSALYNKDKPITISQLNSDDAKRLIAFSWWARAKQNGINEKMFDDFMLDQFDYLDAKFDNSGNFKEVSKRNNERWGKFG
jgi:hypothetical protein